MDLAPDLLGLVELTLFFLAPCAAIVLLVRDVWRLVRPQRRLLQGRLRDAREAADRLGRSWLRVFPSVRRSSLYTVALALHLEGDMDAAAAILAKLRDEDLDRNLRYAVLSLEAGTLVFAGHDAERAVASIEEARAIRETREDVLIAALALLRAGRADEAEQEFARSESMKEPAGTKLGTTILFTLPELKETIERTLRGVYLVETGRAAEAHADLEAAAASTKQNAYSERARSLLPSAVSDADGPPSLAPHVLG